jgi:acyl-CoA dehydrogenase
LVNSHVPPEYGGAGASYLEGSVIVEELAWGCAAIATTLGANDLASAPVLLGGSEATKSTYGGGSSQHGAVDGFGAQAS